MLAVVALAYEEEAEITLEVIIFTNILNHYHDLMCIYLNFISITMGKYFDYTIFAGAEKRFIRPS